MNQVELTALIRSRVLFVEDLRINELVDHLVQDEIISVEQEKQIKACSINNERAKNTALWHRIHSTQKKNAFDMLCRALDECGFEHLKVKLVEEKEKLTSEYSKHQSDSPLHEDAGVQCSCSLQAIGHCLVFYNKWHLNILMIILY